MIADFKSVMSLKRRPLSNHACLFWTTTTKTKMKRWKKKRPQPFRLKCKESQIVASKGIAIQIINHMMMVHLNEENDGRTTAKRNGTESADSIRETTVKQIGGSEVKAEIAVATENSNEVRGGMLRVEVDITETNGGNMNGNGRETEGNSCRDTKEFEIENDTTEGLSLIHI